MKTGYLLIADILGFGNIVKNLADLELEARIGEWPKLIKQLTDKYSLRNFQLLSDTLFLSVEQDDPETLEKLILFCQDLLSIGMKKSIPIKGAITFGQFEWGDFIFGKAVIEAHEIESKQNWIGITLNYGIPNIEKFWSIEKVICYPTPMKSGLIRTYPVIVWEVPEFRELASLMTSHGLSKTNEYLEWSWAEKLKNTLEFKLYLHILKNAGGSAKNFHGFLPIEVIALNLK